MAAFTHAEMATLAARIGAVQAVDDTGRPFGPTGPTAWGQWHDPMYVHLLTGGMELLFDMRFTDKHGRDHVLPAGTRGNGADIPRLAQPAVGESMKGPYVRASLGHDHWLRVMPVDDAHALFYDAMRADGCTEEQADLFYHAVVAKTWWDRLGPLKQFAVSAWRVVRRVLPRL